MTPYERRVRGHTRQPRFENLLDVLAGREPPRPTLFEFYLNRALYERLAGRVCPEDGLVERTRFFADAFAAAGYDHVTLTTPEFFPESRFPTGERGHEKSHSLNEGAVITDERSFDRYPWPDMASLPYERLSLVDEALPDGMKAIVSGPMGVMEILNDIVGYENLCFMVIENPELATRISTEIGSRLVTFYRRCLEYPAIGAVIANDDWGFKTQTMLSPDDLRRYVFPWHREIARIAHDAGRPVILHSCGQLAAVMGDVIDDLKMDGKHSFEDAILPVEDAYDRWGRSIALLGGIDLGFLCNEPLDRIHYRSRAMIEKTGCIRYALGSGNSIPEYVSDDAYFAMISAAFEEA